MAAAVPEPDHTPEVPSAPINLRHARRRLGKSLREIAPEIGVTPRQLQRAENGAIPTRVSDQHAIATFYGLDVVVQFPDPADGDQAAA